MKVLVVLKTNVGGWWVLPQVAALTARGHDVALVIPDGEGRLRSLLAEQNVRVIATRFDFAMTPGAALLRGVNEVRRIVRAEQPDVVMYHLIASALVARAATLGLRSLRTVHMVPGPLYLESRPIAAAEALLCRLDDHVIGGSEYTRAKYARLGYPASRLSGIPYGVDTTAFVRGDDRRSELLGVDPGTFVVIMVAFVYAPKSAVFPGVGIKGHETLLAAWQPFHERHPKSLLVLLGAGFDDAGERHRQRLRTEFGESAGVRWLDSVDDVRPYYSSADISVSPSLSENHGAVSEASSMGLPSIVSDAGGLPETTTDATGWVVPAGDTASLGRALAEAHAEHLRGELHQRGRIARGRATVLFDSTATSERVADVVEGKRARRILVVTEQRCGTNAAGEALGAAPIHALAGVEEGSDVRLVARRASAQPRQTVLLPCAKAVIVPWGGPQAFARAVIALVRETRLSDVVTVSAPGAIGSVGAVIAIVLGKPLAVLVVGDPAEALQPPVTRGLTGVVWRAVMPRAMRAIVGKAATARYVTSHVLQARYPTHAPSVGATDVGPFTPPADDPPEQQRGRILTVASMDQPYKGVAELITAMAQVRSAGVEAHLVVAGDGRLRADLEREARSTLGDGASTFTGHLSAEELGREYAAADLFVLASWTEGMPRALIEAMGHGRACVATDVGGASELLPAWALVAPRDPAALADAMLHLLTDDDLRCESGARNLEVARQLRDDSAAAHIEFVARVHALADQSRQAPLERDGS